MKGLHEDDRAARDASGFRQDSGGIVRVGQHEEEQCGGERSFFERKGPVIDQDRRRPHDMDVAHVGGDHIESQLALEPRRDVAGAGAEVEHRTSAGSHSLTCSTSWVSAVP